MCRARHGARAANFDAPGSRKPTTAGTVASSTATLAAIAFMMIQPFSLHKPNPAGCLTHARGGLRHNRCRPNATGTRRSSSVAPCRRTSAHGLEMTGLCVFFFVFIFGPGVIGIGGGDLWRRSCGTGTSMARWAAALLVVAASTADAFLSCPATTRYPHAVRVVRRWFAGDALEPAPPLRTPHQLRVKPPQSCLSTHDTLRSLWVAQLLADRLGKQLGWCEGPADCLQGRTARTARTRCAGAPGKRD